MPLRTVLAASAIGISIACVASIASAQQVYKWKDANGVTHFSQSPPAKGAQYTKVQLDNAPDVSSNPPAKASEASGASEDSAKPAPAETTGEQADTAANRAKLCKQLASNITLLNGKGPVVAAGTDGQQQVMSDNAREQQLATAKAQQAQYCSGK